MSMKYFLVTHNTKNIKCSSSSSSSSSSRWRRRRSRSAAPAAELKLVSIYKEEENLPRQEMLSDSCNGHFNKQDGKP